MKFLHTSDWHVGRTLNGWSLLEEQEWAFQQIVDLAIREQVDGVIIAGDLYDRAVPPVDAIKLFNKTLARLVLEEQIPVYAISGNHDGAERLHFGRDFFQPQGLHLSTRLEEAFEPIELEDCRFFCFPLSILLMPVFTIRMMRIRRFRELVMPWPTFLRIWKKLLISTNHIFW